MGQLQKSGAGTEIITSVNPPLRFPEISKWFVNTPLYPPLLNKVAIK